MSQSSQSDPIHDLFIIGGGVNGCGIARDAAGRGLSVALAEMNDLASATSSASSKLFHGGLRYLEYFEIGLVRHSLAEREVLLRAMPHISWPMRFVLPLHRDMRFDADTPAGRLLSRVMPWMRGRRPDWLIRLGLFFYDHLGGRKLLPPTRSVSLKGTAEGAPLQERFTRAFEYSDCWVDDSRLVVLCARDAAERGARIMPRCKVRSAIAENGVWRIEVEDEDGVRGLRARMLVNAGGPWVGDIIRNRVHITATEGVRLVRGSHIVTRRLFAHDKCYFLQGSDGRIIFAMPYEQDFTLIGTTDADHPDPDQRPECTAQERRYLLDFVNDYFADPIDESDIVWTYSGVRPLFDDGAASASAATRDYILRVETGAGAPLLNVFGGKITTHRKLAEDALDLCAPFFDGLPDHWTAGASLPGGDFSVTDVGMLSNRLQAEHPFLDDAWALRLIRAYGHDAWPLLNGARTAADLGRFFGATLTESEVRWLIAHEFARTAEDVLWRRSKLGLRMDQQAVAALDHWMRGILDTPGIAADAGSIESPGP